jgi:hypothetical protein
MIQSCLIHIEMSINAFLMKLVTFQDEYLISSLDFKYHVQFDLVYSKQKHNSLACSRKKFTLNTSLDILSILTLTYLQLSKVGVGHGE